MLLAVIEYLKCELKMDSEALKKMEIDNIFQEDKEPDTLFVTFRHGFSVVRIFEKTRLMRKESRINSKTEQEGSWNLITT